MTDPIADMITRIRNAVTAKHTRVELPASKLKAEIAPILQDEGYIQGFRLVESPAEKSAARRGRLSGFFLRKERTAERAIGGWSGSAAPGAGAIPACAEGR